MTLTEAREASAPAPSPAGRPARFGPVATLIALAVALLLIAGWHLTQGTSGTVLADQTVLWGSRIPRLAAGVTVGIALGVAGILLQSLARNPLASPDTLGVSAGSYLAVTIATVLGIALPVWAAGTVAFVGGLVGALIVLCLAGGAATTTTRLILAGSALAMAFQSGTSALLILFAEETKGLLAWGSGSLSQLGLGAFFQAAPVVLLALAGSLMLTRSLDVLALGDDSASSLGIPVRSTRLAGILLAVLLTAVSVTLAGPIGFVGLCAPVLARLLTRLVPGLTRHLFLLPASGLIGALVVILADAVLRAILGAEAAIAIPTGVATTLLGAGVLILVARRSRDAGRTREAPQMRLGVRTNRRFWIVLAAAAAGTGAAVVTGLLLGHTWLLTGDIALWLAGEAPPQIAFALDERAPRVIAAACAGGALALSGALVQAMSRNPLADPGILGVTGGAGLGAVLVITSTVASMAGMIAAAMVGALLSFGLVCALSWRRGMDADRFVLVGIGVSYATVALTTFFLLRANPWDTPKIYTWLSGTTYGRVWDQVIPVAIALLVAFPLVFCLRRDMDVAAVDEDTPRLVGIRLGRVRVFLLLVAAVLAALSVSAVGVIGFVGLVAPHAARALVGARHARALPVAMLLGALLVCVADTVGRSVIAPAQVPAGLVVALIGAPYFVWLLWRSRDA